MNENKNSERIHQIITIPNILSMGRIVLIPIFVWAYHRQNGTLAFWLLVLSGATDIADGFIARTFHMTSNFGKIIDPIADKLTQGAVLLCLGSRFPVMFFLAGLLAVKEITTGLMSLSAIHKTKAIKGADWHGKATTCLLYLTMLLHIFWAEIPQIVSVASVVLCVLMMAISFVMYFHRNIFMIRKG